MAKDLPPNVLAQSPLRGKKVSYKGRGMVTTQEMCAINKMRALRECDALLEAKATTLTEKAIYLALEKDDTVALKMCLDRIIPVPKERPVELAIQSVRTADEAIACMQEILLQVGRGEINLSESKAAFDMIKDMRTILMDATELKDLQARSQLLESRIHHLEVSDAPADEILIEQED